MPTGGHGANNMKHAARIQYAALAALVCIGVLADARNPGKVSATHIGAPQDWSSRAVVFAHPEAPLEAARGKPVHADRVRRLANDPRYVMALARRFERDAARRMPILANGAVHGPIFPRGHRRPLPRRNSLHRDWSNVLGGGNGGLGGKGANGVYPAKYNFDISAAPDCANDFIVYPTDAAGAFSSGTNETYVSEFTGDPGQGGSRTVTIGASGPRQIVLVSSTNNNTGLNFRTSGVNDTTRAANLRDAVNRWTGQTGFSATSDGAEITITSMTTGDIANDAISENLSHFSGDDFWDGINGNGTAGQPTVIAFNQLYNTTCNAGRSNSNAPNVMWAYNTGNGYIAETSPVLSYYDEGKQLAFVQRNGNTLQLVLLKWRQGQGSAAAPASPTLAASAAAYRSCASNCYYAITFNGTSNTDGAATYSSPFVDYFGDVLYVGDGNGRLHKFTGVFKGNPAEATSGGFPATVSGAGIKLSPPVYDFAGNVFVGSQSGGNGVGGMLHRVNASTGAVTSSAKLANNNSSGLRSSPVLDVGTHSVFAFLFNDGTAGDGSTCSHVDGQNDACRVVARFSTGFAAGAAPLQRAYVGRGNNTVSTLYAGAFDDAYYNRANGTGAMYIVGGDPANTFVATLWKIPLANGVMQAPVQGAAVGDYIVGDYDWSPVTLVKNTSNDSNEYLYFSLGATANAAGCSGACLYMFNLDDLNGSGAGRGAAWGTNNVASAGLPTYGGTTGIVVDNISGATGASQVYFSHTASPGNAVQASQGALN